MKVILFRANNIFDSRVQKYVSFYKRVGIEHTIVGWDRNCEGLQRDHYYFYRYKAGVNVGGVKAIWNHLKWMKFVFSTLRNHPEVTTIHACDLNCAFPAAVFKKWFKKDVRLLFDSCDWFSASLGNNKIMKFVFTQMEKFACKMSDELIICEPERKDLIAFPLKKEPLILPNIPEISREILNVNNASQYKFNNDWPTVAYFGRLSSERFHKELLSLSQTMKFNLLIAGFGSKDIEELCVSCSNRDNVKYFGRVDMKTGLEMSMSADLIYAMYCKTNRNNVYAAPNKFYEALFLGKPIITTKGTILENKVVSNNIGYVIEEDVEELRQLLQHLSMQDIEKKGRNAAMLWETRYSTYVANFFDSVYSKILS